MEEKSKLTIRKALELLQKIRYYDKNGNIVFLMDESEEIYYLNDICEKYDGTPKQIVRKMKFASRLESVGLINTNVQNRNNESIDSNKLIPIIKIKRRNNYK